MTELLEAADGIEDVSLEPSLTHGFTLECRKAVGTASYTPEDIEEIVQIEEEEYRSAANAAAWSAIAGMLGGGRLGMLVGAAVGARKISAEVWMARMKDGQHVAFKQESGLALMALRRHLGRAEDEDARIAVDADADADAKN